MDWLANLVTGGELRRCREDLADYRKAYGEQREELIKTESERDHGLVDRNNWAAKHTEANKRMEDLEKVLFSTLDVLECLQEPSLRVTVTIDHIRAIINKTN